MSTDDKARGEIEIRNVKDGPILIHYTVDENGSKIPRSLLIPSPVPDFDPDRTGGRVWVDRVEYAALQKSSEFVAWLQAKAIEVYRQA